MLRSLYGYTQQARKLSLEEFANKFPAHVLVIEPFVPIEIEESAVQTSAVGHALSTGVPKVGELKKLPGANKFSMMITLGRASNNDVKIDGKGISKFHAYVRFPQGGPSTLTDAGSTNGTFVRGEQLEKRATTEIQPGDAIQLGNIAMVYYDPQGFYDHLLAVLADPEQALT